MDKKESKMDEFELNKLREKVKDEKLKEIYRRFGTKNLKKCPECEQQTMEVCDSLTDYGETSYMCHFCGYYKQSNWTSCIHGKFT